MIGRIYVINLNRQPARWAEMEQELKHVLDWSGDELWNLTERYAAVDAKNFKQEPLKDADVDPIYTLGDQLFVEPQPLVLPTQLELNSPIRMSRPEIAIARSTSSSPHALSICMANPDLNHTSSSRTSTYS